MFAFPCAFNLAFASVSVGGIVVRSSTGIAAVFLPMSSSAAVLAGRAMSFLVLVFSLALPLDFLERVNLHPVIICTRSVSR